MEGRQEKKRGEKGVEVGGPGAADTWNPCIDRQAQGAIKGAMQALVGNKRALLQRPSSDLDDDAPLMAPKQKVQKKLAEAISLLFWPV